MPARVQRHGQTSTGHVHEKEAATEHVEHIVYELKDHVAWGWIRDALAAARLKYELHEVGRHQPVRKPSPIPPPSALAISSRLLCTPTFSRMALRWSPTVKGERSSRSAIS